MIPELALTVKQPFASAIIAGVKPLDNRSWMPPLPDDDADEGLRIFVHAGLTTHDRADLARALWSECLPDDALPRGAIIGEVLVVDVVGVVDEYLRWAFNPWYRGPYGWIFARPIAYAQPVPCAGKVRLWRPDAGTLTLCELARGRAAREGGAS